MSRGRVYHAPRAPQVLPQETRGAVEHRENRPEAKYHWDLKADAFYEILTPELVTWKLDRWQLTHG